VRLPTCFGPREEETNLWRQITKIWRHVKGCKKNQKMWKDVKSLLDPFRSCFRNPKSCIAVIVIVQPSLCQPQTIT
jgi:hypothetical protein